jgi:hypothetical protein
MDLLRLDEARYNSPNMRMPQILESAMTVPVDLVELGTRKKLDRNSVILIYR